ncbi:MAG: glycosyltransferase family 2 protein [Actinomycetia bacterium]|nr:glycosyltransferase family 2 protein [Actinomycetes bacterium]
MSYPRTNPTDRTAPMLTIGLPVYNGERYLPESLDALLAQTYTDFELIISDNASDDGTADICRSYAERDARIRYVRQPVNIGAAPNHNILVPLANGRYFKWASDDDLYDPELIRLCVEALEERPDYVLAHAWEAFIDGDGQTQVPVDYTLETADPDPAVRLRSMLFESGGDDFYGVIRTEVLRRVGEHGSYYNADRTFVASISLHGPFYQVPKTLYFRRDHPERATRAGTRRDRAAALDPRRADRVRNPMILMYAEYIAGYLRAIRRAPLAQVDRFRCSLEVGRWLLSRLRPGRKSVLLEDTLWSPSQ